MYLLCPLIKDNPAPTVVPVQIAPTNHFKVLADELLLDLMRVPESETREERLDRERRLSRFIPVSEDHESRTARRVNLHRRPIAVRRLIHSRLRHVTTSAEAASDGEDGADAA